MEETIKMHLTIEETISRRDHLLCHPYISEVWKEHISCNRLLIGFQNMIKKSSLFFVEVRWAPPGIAGREGGGGEGIPTWWRRVSKPGPLRNNSVESLWPYSFRL